MEKTMDTMYLEKEAEKLRISIINLSGEMQSKMMELDKIEMEIEKIKNPETYECRHGNVYTKCEICAEIAHHGLTGE